MQMKLEQWCHDFEAYLPHSPLRADQTLQTSVSQDVRQNLEKVALDLEKIQKNIFTTLRVALIGEVKAGKSTLINALVGYAVSPTDMLEATSVIWEIGYAPTDSTLIHFKNGDRREVEHRQVMSIVGTELESLAQAHRIEKIAIKTKHHNLKNLLLIDSPGLATITAQNAALTKNIIIETDVVVWVVNGNHLGQIDIFEDIVSIAHLGKPIVAVINKIDEVDEDYEALIEYLDGTAGDYLQHIFALSAFKALPDNHDSRDNSDETYTALFKEFTAYLQTQVDAKAQTVKIDSLQDSCEALVRRELIAHQSIIRQTREKIEAYDDYQDDLRRDKARIEKSLTLELEQQYNELLKNNAFEQDIKNYMMTTSTIAEADLLPIMHRYNDPIKTKIEDSYNKNVKKAFEVNSHQIVDRFKRFQALESQYMQATMEQHGIYDSVQGLASSAVEAYDNVATVKDSAVKGGMVFGAAGTALAGYAAVLGANASAITLGAALSAVALPLAVAGLAGGAAYGFFKMKDKKANELKLQVHNTMKQMADSNKQSLIDGITHGLEMNFREMEERYIETICAGKSLNQQHKLLQSATDYIDGLHTFIRN